MLIGACKLCTKPSFFSYFYTYRDRDSRHARNLSKKGGEECVTQGLIREAEPVGMI